MSTNNGIKNEIEIEAKLNGKLVADLEPNMRDFVCDIFELRKPENLLTKVEAERSKDSKYKPDLFIELKNLKKNISIKYGSGNSVHQETIYSFVNYIRNVLKADDNVVNALLFFHWGDGTLDGSGATAHRMKASEIIKEYPHKIELIQKFFNAHKYELLVRFLSEGIFKISHVDYIYYGSFSKGAWSSLDSIISFLIENDGSLLSVGGLNFQNYGRSLQGKDDKRRESIQIKWSNMSSFFMSEKSLPDFNSRIKGDNSHGFKNVAAIIDALNNKRVLEVQESLLEFIYELFPNASSVSAISCKKISGLKGDILIWLDKDKKNTKNISVISGSGNSVHQENIYAFNSYLKNELGAPDELIQSYNSFHFADGTCDNTGGVEARVSAREYKNLHPMELKRVQLFLDRHRRVLLERFIKKNYDFPDVDYIFYGNTELPYWAKIEDLIESEMKIKNNTRATLSVGNLSLQTWNRSLMGRTDDRRLALQVKWGSLRSDVRNIYDRKNGQKRNRAIMGLNYEYEFANMLNKDKDHEIWDKIGFKGNNNDKYIVNVSFNQTSKLAGTKVRPKSDCYVARLNSEIDALMTEKNYVLTEELLAEKGIFYEPIPKTGISVKIPNSTSYTIQKLSFSSFKNIFTQLDPLCFAGSMLYTDKKQLQKNELITTTFGTSIAELCNHLGITYSEKSDEKMYPLLKSAAVSQIKRMLQTDSSVFGAICYGDGLFEEPYCSQYVFEKSKLQTKYEYKPKIMVTTGSGRSKGIFTLAFK